MDYPVYLNKKPYFMPYFMSDVEDVVDSHSEGPGHTEYIHHFLAD